jgi:hypothetical protein
VVFTVCHSFIVAIRLREYIIGGSTSQVGPFWDLTTSELHGRGLTYAILQRRAIFHPATKTVLLDFSSEYCLMSHTLKRISHISGRFCVWEAPKSGLGRRSASSYNSKESGPAQTQRTHSRRPNPRNGNRSDSQVNADVFHVPSLLWYQRLGPATRFFGWYDRTQTKNPYMTQLFSSLLIYLFGDQLAQGVGGEPYDGKRTLRHITIGAIMSLPGYRW